ncbi:MAG: 4Fe-4S dicluster domain-containing protein [Anaerolineae bacterium]|nr:4Fe-4S dicluster domain-containing protein [Anaerolineae bacterium]
MAEDKYRWGMVVDLDLCTGCQACVVACHAENNVPTVGEVETARRRSMHWIRIERYWHGADDELRAEFMPLLCQHCQNAPCEPVCPMYATYHDPNNQLNIQVYNRCAGIRYCGVNCPYKVRHFNWFDPYFPEPLNEQLNPDVTVRRRGIMEKCMFCIQRIRRARDEARARGEPFNTEEVKPACVQTCPTDALVFGNLLEPESEVARLARSPRAFVLLEDLGTEPSLFYLKRGESYVRTG